MNRIRLTVLSGFVTLGTLGFGPSPSQAQDYYINGSAYVVAVRTPMSSESYIPPRPPAYNIPSNVAVPRYFIPGAAPTYNVRRYPTPARPYRRPAPRTSAWVSDPTGRHDGLARPWLQPSR